MEETIGGALLELEVCAPEIGRSAHPCGRSVCSGNSALCLAIPDSSIDESADDRIVILKPSWSIRFVYQNALP
jgi:hypothetical protein